MEQRRGLGPGSIRVGRFIGRLGVVGMPAVGVGLRLAERVVRRHVARLEAEGWLARQVAIRGEGPLIWLTGSGQAGVGLGELAAVRAPAAFSRQTMHSVQVAWVAAELERGGVGWLAVRELALDRERWQVPIANERGGTSRRLPDLVARPQDISRRPVAIVLERHSPHHHKRQHAALVGWQAAIASGRYAQVRYQTAPNAASGLTRLAREIGLTAPQFVVEQRVNADQLVTSPPTGEPDLVTSTDAQRPPAPLIAPPSPPPTANVNLDPPEPQELADTPPPPAVAPRSADEVLRELLGDPNPRPRRRWRRRP